MDEVRVSILADLCYSYYLDDLGFVFVPVCGWGAGCIVSVTYVYVFPGS